MRNIKENFVTKYVKCVKYASIFEKNAKIVQYLIQSVAPYYWLVSCTPISV